MRLTKQELEDFPTGTKVTSSKRNEYVKNKDSMWVKNGCNKLSNKTMARKEIIQVLIPKVEYGEWHRPEEALDHVEKEYLGNIIKPFRDRVEYIEKIFCGETCQIWIYIEYAEPIMLPPFNTDSMYKKMIPGVKYSANIVDELEE